jgi:hypothetical protein
MVVLQKHYNTVMYMGVAHSLDKAYHRMRNEIDEVLVLHNVAEIDIYIVENIILKLKLTGKARARLQNRLAASRNAR